MLLEKFELTNVFKKSTLFISFKIVENQNFCKVFSVITLNYNVNFKKKKVIKHIYNYEINIKTCGVNLNDVSKNNKKMCKIKLGERLLKLN